MEESRATPVSFHMGLILCLPHPQKSCKAWEERSCKKRIIISPFHPPLPFSHPQITEHPTATQRQGWNRSQRRCDWVSRLCGPRSLEVLAGHGVCLDQCAMPINRYLSGFISVERRRLLLSSARAQRAGSWVNNTLFSRKFHSTGACFRGVWFEWGLMSILQGKGAWSCCHSHHL